MLTCKFCSWHSNLLLSKKWKCVKYSAFSEHKVLPLEVWHTSPALKHNLFQQQQKAFKLERAPRHMWQKCLGRHYKILWIPDQIKNIALRRGKKESFLENQVIIESLVLCVPVPETLRKLCLPVVLSLMWRMLTKPPCSKWALSSSASHAIASDTANNTPPISRPAIFWLISEYGTKLERSPDKYI